MSVRFKQVATEAWDIKSAYDVENIQEQLAVTVGEDDVPFQFAYDSTNEVYGFMVGEVFHPFGRGEVIE